MADDIKIKLGLDATELFNGITKATSELNKLAGSADKAETEIKQLDNQKVDIDIAPAESGLNSLAAKAKDLGSEIKSSFNMQSLASGVAGGIAGGLATGGISTIISGIQSIGSNIFNAAMEADEFGDTLEVAFKQQGIEDVDAEIEKVSKSTRQLADDLGLPTQRTRELATTVATMGGISGKQAEELTKLSAGLETFSGGAVKGEAVALAFSKGLADPEGAAAIEKLAKKYPQLAETLRSNIEPAEKMKIANDLLGESFKTVADQQSDAGGTFNKLSNALSAAYETIGTGIMDVINMVIPIFQNTLGPIFSEFGETVGGVFERIWSIVQPILSLIGGAIITGIVVAIDSVLVVLNTLYTIWTTVFDAIKKAVMPLVDTLKQAFGMDGALGEGMDVVKLFTDALGMVTEIIGEVGVIVAEFGGLLVEFIITPFQGIIEVIADVVRSIGGWISSNDDNTESVKQSGTAVKDTKSFIDILRQAFDNIRGTIGGVKESFTQIKITIGEFWDAITQFDIQKALSAFTGFGDKLSAAYDKGFNATKDAIKKTNQVVKEGGDEAARLASARAAAEKIAADKAAAEKKKKEEEERKRLAALNRGKTPEAASALEQLKKDLKDEEDEIKSSNFFKLQEAVKAGEDEKVAKARLDAESKATLREFLNTRLANVKDANAILNQEQATSIIKPSAKKGETVQDVLSFYTDSIAKFSQGAGAEIKVKLGAENDKEIQDQLKNLVKRIQDQSKSLEGSLDKLIPASAVKTTEELKKVQDSYDSYANYVKGQALDIQAAIDVAIGLGDEKTQRLLEQQLEANQTALNDAKTKLDKFAKDSAAEIEKNSGLSGALLTFQAALNDAFNIEKIRKERETNEQIRQERLNALNAEEDDLTTSLAKREISFEDYAAKIADIDKARQDAMEATETSFMERMKGVLDQTVGNVLKGQATAITSYVSDQFKDTEGNVSESGKIIGNMMGNLATQFGELALSGKATLADFARSSVMVAYQALQQMIPIFIAEIAGKQFAELGLLGIAAAAGLTVVLNGLFAAAAPSLGFKDGVVGLEGPGDERSDSIPAWLSKGESVITAAGTRANREELEWMNKNPGMSIRDYFTAQAPQVRYSVQEDGNLIQEVRKLREETRGLGKQINRNTHVEISGALVADNNSIKAVIERDRRRNARRG